MISCLFYLDTPKVEKSPVFKTPHFWCLLCRVQKRSQQYLKLCTNCVKHNCESPEERSAFEQCSFPLSSQLYLELLVPPSSRRRPPPASPSPGTPVTPTLFPITSSSTVLNLRTASMRRWTPSPRPATASAGCTPTPSTRSVCPLSTPSARVRPATEWKLGPESKPLPAHRGTSRHASYHRTR